MVTGVSGSGKSSLAFDTIYAEGQRRYVESLSAYARQFLERIEKPDVDLIDGIAPAIAIKQKNTTRNPRSTVATATEIYDYLRLLYARVGRTFCMQLRRRVKRDTVDEIADAILALAEGTRLYVLFPVRRLQPAHQQSRQRRRRRESRRKQAAPAEDLSSLKARLVRACASAASTGSTRTGRSSSSPRRNRCSTSTSRSRSTCWSIASRSRAENRARIVDAVEIGYREAGEVIFETAPREGEKPRSASGFRSASSASTATCATTSRSRGCFPSTIHMALAHAARASATPSISIIDLVVPDKSRRSTTARSSRGPSRSTVRCARR